MDFYRVTWTGKNGQEQRKYFTGYNSYMEAKNWIMAWSNNYGLSHLGNNIPNWTMDKNKW